MREKLIKLIDVFSAPVMLLDTKLMDWKIPTQQLREAIADHLISNDVVPVVRCKDCRYCDPERHYCDHPMSTSVPIPRKSDDFCSYGERKDGA